MQADDAPAIEAVLSADTQRVQLLEEEKKLVAESEAGDDSNSEKLKQVCGQTTPLKVVFIRAVETEEHLKGSET